MGIEGLLLGLSGLLALCGLAAFRWEQSRRGYEPAYEEPAPGQPRLPLLMPRPVDFRIAKRFLAASLVCFVALFVVSVVI